MSMKMWYCSMKMESKRALLEMLVKIRWKIRCGIGAEEGDPLLLVVKDK